ncbi:MAG: carboxypeptidase M32 [Phycisphaerales bacterium]
MPAATVSETATSYNELLERLRKATLLQSVDSLLGWDQETMMPDGGVEYRSQQLALMAGLAHEAATDARIGELLSECEANPDLTTPDSESAANLREIRRDFDRATKLPPSLVRDLAETSSKAMHEWQRARKDSDFKRFRPWLTKLIDLTTQKAKCYGWAKGGEIWDALADEYEPGMTAAWVAERFGPLRDRLGLLLDALMGSSVRPSNRFNELSLPIDAQKRFVHFVSESIGFDFSRGRLDTSTHPFCSSTHCHDVRMTTRFHENNMNDALGSTMHETGHGIYEQGLPFDKIGSPLGDAVSLGIHESQSRMWENQVGRSRAFWTWCMPKLRDFFGDDVASLSFDDVYGGANIVEPGFIRVEADEATYNMHIMIRFEMERGILSGDIGVDDIPDAWNAKYKEYLGLTVPDDRRGCLQDVHWSMGSMGYFPTYTLGNMYCAQFFEAAKKAIPDLLQQFERGEFNTLKGWLNENIHQHGRRYLPEELCQRVTGKPLSADPLMRHLESKLKPLYGL